METGTGLPVTGTRSGVVVHACCRCNSSTEGGSEGIRSSKPASATGEPIFKGKMGELAVPVWERSWCALTPSFWLGQLGLVTRMWRRAQGIAWEMAESGLIGLE